MSNDRIKEIRIRGFRSIKNISLRLDGMTVLIGENATGKSSILEALVLLQRAAGAIFFQQFNDIHGGLNLLLRQGSPALELGLSIEGPSDFIEYDFAIGQEGNMPMIVRESLRMSSKGAPSKPASQVIDRQVSEHKALDPDTGKEVRTSIFSPDRLILTSFTQGTSPGAAIRVLEVLGEIEVHLPFDVQSSWTCREERRVSATRDSKMVSNVRKIERFGANLANAYYQLRNEPDWDETMALVKLGLGNFVQDVVTRPERGSGTIGLRIRYSHAPDEVPAAGLSDGTLAYLGFVALCRLSRGKSALVAFDEPDLHLHPYLLVRVVDLLEDLAEKTPVVLATHSDWLLDLLRDSAASAVVCELDEEGATVLKRPDSEALKKWREKYNYRGLGSVRKAGHMASVMAWKGKDEPQ